MSRARFAAQFTERAGSPPGDYLTALRMGLAQRLLSRGQPLEAVAAEVGYGSANALSRAFQQRIGQTPSDWLRQREAA
jgi:AraC-like DNA-binding protein